MRRASKSVDATTLDFSDFSGGLNLLDASENIAQNELSSCINMTYSTQPGRLRTRRGIGSALHAFTNEIKGMYWFKSVLMIVADSYLWEYDGVTLTQIGAVTGSLRPGWCEFGGDLYVATGGKIQKFVLTGAALTTIDGSKDNTIGLYARFGRLFCWCSNSDYRYGSASGDASNWTVPSNPTASDPVEQQIGYKVAGNIICCIPMLTDVVVFKDNCIMRIVEGSGSSTEGIYEVCRGEELANKRSVVNVGGQLFYIDRSKGMRLLEGVTSYGDMLPSDALKKVNTWIRSNITDDCAVWHLRGRKMIIVGAGGKTCITSYYDYGIDAMPSLMWTFKGNLVDFAEPSRDKLYVAIGNSFYSLTNIENVDSSFSSKEISGTSQYLIKRIMVNATTLTTNPSISPVNVYCSDKKILEMIFGSSGSPQLYANIEAVYPNDDPIYGYRTTYEDFAKHNTIRNKTIQIKFDSSGAPPFELAKFLVEAVPVGVVA